VAILVGYIGRDRGRQHTAGASGRRKLAFCRALPQKSPVASFKSVSMIDFAAARRMMVDGQIRTADVTDPRLLAAMLALPRERFLPEDKVGFAYLDFDVPVRDGAGRAGRRLLKPMVLAKLLQAAEVAVSDHVLDVGCATGYSSALLGAMAGSVVALEEDVQLFRQAREALAQSDAGKVKLVAGPLAAGCPGEGPYDLIMLEGATEIVPATLLDQLKDGGRLLSVLGRGPGGKAMIFCLIDGDISRRPLFDATAALLPGFAQPPAFVF
jgi:protein-L-isoaspartate(D-aspartate) O-methyltransferase